MKGGVNHVAARAALDPISPLRPHRESDGEGVHGRQGEIHISSSRDGARRLCCHRRRDLCEHWASLLHVDFVRRWLSAFIVGWPVAAVTAYIAFPIVRQATVRIVALIEGKSV